MDQLTIPPIRTPLTDDPNEPQTTKQWWYYWQRIADTVNQLAATPPPTAAGGPYVRTLLLKDTTVGNDIADHVPIYQAGPSIRAIGVLRKAITANLTVRVNLNAPPGYTGGSALITLTIPSTTAIDHPVTSTTFTPSDFPDLGVLTWDVTASDGSVDSNGVASVTISWEAPAASS